MITNVGNGSWVKETERPEHVGILQELHFDQSRRSHRPGNSQPRKFITMCLHRLSAQRFAIFCAALAICARHQIFGNVRLSTVSVRRLH